jgi:DNA polymerase III delta subunit
MLILLSGPDEYRRSTARREIAAEFAKKHPDAVRGRFDFSEDDALSAFERFLGGQSLFASIKLAILENVSAETSKRFTEIIRDTASRKDAVLVMGDAKTIPEAIKRIAKKYEGKGKEVTALEYDYLEGRAWRNFVQATATKEGALLEDDAVDYFAGRYAKDTWGLVTELRKVSMLSKKTLARKDVESLDVAATPDFFGLIGGLKSQRASDRLTALERVFATNGPAAKFFNILAYGGPGYAERFARYDVMIKSGVLEHEEALLDSIL